MSISENICENAFFYLYYLFCLFKADYIYGIFQCPPFICFSKILIFKCVKLKYVASLLQIKQALNMYLKSIIILSDCFYPLDSIYWFYLSTNVVHIGYRMRIQLSFNHVFNETHRMAGESSIQRKGGVCFVEKTLDTFCNMWTGIVLLWNSFRRVIKDVCCFWLCNNLYLMLTAENTAQKGCSEGRL